MARVALEAMFRMDVRPILQTISAPNLVIHARDEVTQVQCGRYVVDHIPGARWLEVEGSDHAPWLADPDKLLTEVEVPHRQPCRAISVTSRSAALTPCGVGTAAT